jgi:UDP-N-acetyl-D-glucosamine dehydrogenase
MLKKELELSGLTCGNDFFLAFSPEREDPGNKSFSTVTIPKLVGGVDKEAGLLAAAVYRAAIDKVIIVSSAKVAEAAKLTENIFRAVNIALVNELKVIYARMGIDVWDVLDAAATKPFGFMRFNPGPGLGGHCIPLDPYYLAWKAREYGVTTRFIELAGQVNVDMPQYVMECLQNGLNEREKSVKGSRVLVLGLAYKKDIDDPRESPSFELIELLLQRGARVDYHDPHLPMAPSMRSFPRLPPMKSVPLTPELLRTVDAVLIATDHSAVDYKMVLDHAPLIVDSRGVYREPHSNVVKA